MYSQRYKIVKIILMGPMRDVLRGPIPQSVNDVTECTSAVYLDTYTEDLHVKSVLKLVDSNKNLGGPDALVMAARLSSFLRTVDLMLESVSLRESELELIHIPTGRPIVDALLELVESIEATLKRLREQFGKIKGPA
jgi:hypothetical protein